MIPKILLEISNPPKKLFYRGKELDSDFNGIAIIGTRKATPLGMAMARKISEELSAYNIPIISGLALGIDTASHEGALASGGKTIAVLGSGLNTIYPPENRFLYEKIIQSAGTIVSEYEDDVPPQKHHFLARNRIISGLALAILVIEAPLKSGSINTASHAAENGREVFVLPGPANHENYAGSHKLIRDGAKLVTSTEDILEDLGLDAIYKQTKLNLPQGSEVVFKALKEATAPLSIDKIISITKLKPQIVALNLTELILAGIVIETGGDYSIK